MKLLAISFVALLAASCGKVEVKSGTKGLGELRGLSPVTMAPGDMQTFDQICAGLTTKIGKFGTSTPTLKYDVQRKNCDGEENQRATQLVSVFLIDGTYQLRNRDTNAPFVFQSAESPTDGIFSGICGQASVTMPILLNNGSAKWVRVGGECPGANGDVCVTVEIGAKEPTSGFYRVHTREFVRFNVQNLNGKYGHFTYRRRLAEGTCDVGAFEEDIVNML